MTPAAMRDTLAAIRALHCEAPLPDLSGWSGVCEECDRPWPCASYALAGGAVAVGRSSR